MHDSEVSFGQACRLFWSFAWRFTFIAGVFGAIGYGALKLSSSNIKSAANVSAASAVTIDKISFRNPIVPTVAIILIFVAGAISMQSVVSAGFEDLRISVRAERRNNSPIQQDFAARFQHSNPLSRNPTTAKLKPVKTTKLIYRD